MSMKLAVVGAGLMGGGIALDAARHGLSVTVFDARSDGVDKLRDRAAATYARWTKNGKMQPGEAKQALARIATAPTLADLAHADLLIEAVFEDFTVKRALFDALAPHVGDEMVIATNTSALEVGALASGFAFAGRFLGLHYFSPSEVSPLVEVVRARDTSAEAVERALAFLAQTKRVPLACRDRPGFAINRFFCPYYNEATRLVAEGIAGPADVDRVARERIGAAAGPFTVMNLIRPAVAAHAMANLAMLGPFYEPSAALRTQAERGDDWPVEQVLNGADLDLVEDRLLGALLLSAMELAGEDVADPVSVDHGAVLALKFAEGPFTLMRRYPADRVERAVISLCRRSGHPVPPLQVAAV
ncbi:3-hydroxyacyl-CoA dehydrogenase NAD-binding domain-containing protein [Xanthobacter autotrophicus]|uniref:3-hydroxyacyl-CoA dehydrogenase n=1 Tax=Xanthobacter autotrophicus TaxID=280 RepID=UPI00372A1351